MLSFAYKQSLKSVFSKSKCLKSVLTRSFKLNNYLLLNKMSVVNSIDDIISDVMNYNEDTNSKFMDPENPVPIPNKRVSNYLHPKHFFGIIFEEII